MGKAHRLVMGGFERGKRSQDRKNRGTAPWRSPHRGPVLRESLGLYTWGSVLGIQQALGLHCQGFDLTPRTNEFCLGHRSLSLQQRRLAEPGCLPILPTPFQLGYPTRQWFSKDAL